MKSRSAYLLLCLGSLALLMHGILPHHHHEGGVLNEHAHHFSHVGGGEAQHGQAAHADARAHTPHAAEHGHAEAHGHDHAVEAIELEDLGLTGHLHAAEDAHDHGLEHGFHSFEIPIRGKVLDWEPGLSASMLAMLGSLLLPAAPTDTKGLRAPPAPPPNSQTYPHSTGLRGPPAFIA